MTAVFDGFLGLFDCVVREDHESVTELLQLVCASMCLGFGDVKDVAGSPGASGEGAWPIAPPLGALGRRNRSGRPGGCRTNNLSNTHTHTHTPI